MTNRQDWHVCELSQAGISSRAYTPGPYSNREDLLYAFDRMIVGVHGRVHQSRYELEACPTVAASSESEAYAGGVAVFRFGSKNGVFTTVASTWWRTASTVTSICSCVPSA